MENDGFWRTVWRPRSMINDKRTGSGSKWFLFIESLWGLMNSRISTEYVSIESRRDHELLIVIFQKFYKFPYSFLYCLDAIMDEMRKRVRHFVQYFCRWNTSANSTQESGVNTLAENFESRSQLFTLGLTQTAVLRKQRVDFRWKNKQKKSNKQKEKDKIIAKKRAIVILLLWKYFREIAFIC